MPWQAKVTVKGLTKTLTDIKWRNETLWPQSANQMTKKLGRKLHERYVANLSGDVPSTTARPLPVGVVSGDLRSKAKLRQINQFAFVEENTSDHAAFIEVGTRHITPRRPLGEATDYLATLVPGAANEVVSKAWQV
jgi:hypothetical protein